MGGVRLGPGPSLRGDGGDRRSRAAPRPRRSPRSATCTAAPRGARSTTAGTASAVTATPATGRGRTRRGSIPSRGTSPPRVFKCRSTPTGTLPTDEDLYHSVSRGFVTTNMPPWFPLTSRPGSTGGLHQDVLAALGDQGPGTPITVPPETPATMESILHGRELFQKMECWKCHGPAGHGDGPSASTLTDSKDNPIRPYNFASGSRFKCGATNEDLYRIFMTGLDGTPMPSFADNIQPAEAWDLVHFLRTLQPVKTPEAAGLAGLASRRMPTSSSRSARQGPGSDRPDSLIEERATRCVPGSVASSAWWWRPLLVMGALARAGESRRQPITGTVTFTGTPPKMKPIDMAKEPTCASQHPTPVMTETVVTGPGNTVQNVVVYISAGDQPAPGAGGAGALRPEGVRVHAARRRPAGRPAAGDLQQRPDVPQHPPAGEGQPGVEQVPAARHARRSRRPTTSPSSSRSSATSIPGCTATSRCWAPRTTR